MESVFIRELERYSKSQMLKILGDNKEIFYKLRDHSIIRKDKNNKYYFKFVGIIILGDFVINFYPKYITADDDEVKKIDFKQVLKVLKKANKANENFSYENDESEDSFNLLPLMLFLIEDYFENGVYTDIKKILEINGDGEINWDRTINGTLPLIKNDEPYYMELHTHRKIDDIYDYFRLLHEYIITDCFTHLEDANLLYYFDLTPVRLSDKSESDFGDKDYILQRLEKELNIEFNTHKQQLLKLMHSYISNKDSFANENFFTLYGTSNYEVIWEKMCSEVFENIFTIPLNDLKVDGRVPDLDLEKLLNDLDLKHLLNDLNLEEITLKHLIEKPNWISEEGYSKLAEKTYIPDIITISNNNFIILDAKYYNLEFEKNEGDDDPILSGQPGIESISKQYFYDLAFRNFVQFIHFKCVRNAFLLPSYDSKINKKCYNKGYVELKMLHDLGLENIQIIMLPANEINNKYLNNDKMDISDLGLNKYDLSKRKHFNKIGGKYCFLQGSNFNQMKIRKY